MAVEIEAKMAIEDLNGVREKLRESGATPAGKYLETNTFFDTNDHSLQAADRGLRLRLNRNVESSEETYIITYKGPRQLGPLKSREEVELMVEGALEATRLLEALGYKKMVAFEKKRESWIMGDCKVELDELPYLGSYVEVEGLDEAAVLRVRQSLGLSDRPVIKTGYVALLMGYLQERGRPQRDIKFPPS